MSRFYWKHVAAALAALSAVATLVTVLFDLEVVKQYWPLGVIGSALVVGGSFAYACWQTRSKKRIVLDLSSELKLTISEGDLFDQEDAVICIPFNEFFDTHVGDGVIDEKSIHGYFIKRFFNDRIPELEGKIRPMLSAYKSTKQTRRLSTCPDQRYELGTCIDLREGTNTYVLFALTHFNDFDKASVSRAEYTEVVVRLMNHLDGMVQGRPVYMPLFGTGLSRMRRTAQRILLHLVGTLDFNDSCTIPGGVNIVIKSLKDMNVNLTTLGYLVKHGISRDDEDDE